MDFRLHQGGQFRRWLGERFGGDFALGDRLWRRILHGLGATVLVYFVVPNRFFVIAPKEVILLVLLGLVLVAELLRFTVGLELPTVRAYESRRVGGYVYFAVALTIAVLLFPEPIAVAVVLGTAFVDPVAGELRTAAGSRSLYPAVPVALYAGLAFASLAIVGRWPWELDALLALTAAALAVAVERPKLPWVDDDFVMTVVPALFLYGVGVIALGLPR
jgi:dolichol kinase